MLSVSKSQNYLETGFKNFWNMYTKTVSEINYLNSHPAYYHQLI